MHSKTYLETNITVVALDNIVFYILHFLILKFYKYFKMKSSILKEAINSILVKRLETVPESEWGRDSYRHEHSTEPSSSNSSGASSKDSTPSGSNSNSRKNSEEANSSTLKKKSRFMFYSTNLVEHRIVQPGSSCLPFPWTHCRDEK